MARARFATSVSDAGRLSPFAGMKAASRRAWKIPQFLHWTPLAFGATLFTDFLRDLRGDGNLFNIGSFNLHATDIALGIGVIALLLSRPGLRKIDILRCLVFGIGVVVGFTLLRGLAQSPFQALFTFCGSLNGDRPTRRAVASNVSLALPRDAGYAIPSIYK